MMGVAGSRVNHQFVQPDQGRPGWCVVLSMVWRCVAFLFDVFLFMVLWGIFT